MKKILILTNLLLTGCAVNNNTMLTTFKVIGGVTQVIAIYTVPNYLLAEQVGIVTDNLTTRALMLSESE